MAATHKDTIFALSSGKPPAAIAVIRISGPRAGDALTVLGVKIPKPRYAALARIRGRDDEIIDEALALWFPGPHSETGEDVAELQIHGGAAVIAATLDALGRIDGLRPAEAGEFTRRAFENGKLDLTAVEGLADLVSAETQGQRRQAFRQMKGLLGDRAETWRQRLIQALAMVEAGIDFSDEGDVPEELIAPALAVARELAAEIGAALADGHRGERIREGLVVAIAGPPNAGKSTLLNRLARREAAIVSPYAGTTRDVIEVHLDLGGMAVTLLDTAGIRETDDPVELEGVRRARDRAAGADLVLWVEDASQPEGAGPLAEPGASGSPPGVDQANRAGDAPGVETVAQQARLAVEHLAGSGEKGASPPVWRIRNKVDLVQGVSGGPATVVKSEQKLQFNNPLTNIGNVGLTTKSESNNRTNDNLTSVVVEELTHRSESPAHNNDDLFILSAMSGQGFDTLVGELTRFAAAFVVGSESALITRARHRHALEEVLAALDRALAPTLAGQEDLVAEELRAAAASLGRLTGRVDVEDVLDVIFRDFCIGK